MWLICYINIFTIFHVDINSFTIFHMEFEHYVQYFVDFLHKHVFLDFQNVSIIRNITRYFRY